MSSQDEVGTTGNLFLEMADLPEEELHPDLQEALAPMSMGGQRIVHRLMVQIFYNPKLNAYYNRLYEQQKRLLDEAIDRRKWSAYLLIHEKPFRLEALCDIQECLTDREYWTLLGDTWREVENLWQYDKALLLDLLTAQKFDREYLMDENDRELFDVLPEEFVVYRGHARQNQMGLSWTLSYWQAKWFANRWEPGVKGKVSLGMVNKKDVLAIFRDEAEVVIDPASIRQVRPLKPPLPSSFVEQVRPYANSAFQLGPGSIHGPWHWAKVDRNAWWLAEKTPGCDRLVARLFAILHDCQRRDEYKDPHHGERAAAYAEQLYNGGVLKKLRPNQLELLKEACRLHEKGLTTTDPTLGVCWDADRLDLIRVNIIPNPQFLSTDAAKKYMWMF